MRASAASRASEAEQVSQPGYHQKRVF
jgi:hypothetical protein